MCLFYDLIFTLGVVGLLSLCKHVSYVFDNKLNLNTKFYSFSIYQ